MVQTVQLMNELYLNSGFQKVRVKCFLGFRMSRIRTFTVVKRDNFLPGKRVPHTCLRTGLVS
jgi:hypothetical protein